MNSHQKKKRTPVSSEKRSVRNELLCSSQPACRTPVSSSENRSVRNEQQLCSSQPAYRTNTPLYKSLMKAEKKKSERKTTLLDSDKSPVDENAPIRNRSFSDTVRLQKRTSSEDKKKVTIVLSGNNHEKKNSVTMRFGPTKSRRKSTRWSKKSNGIYFGVLLEESFESASSLGHLHFALLCITFIELHGLNVEGIFRISGSTAIVQEWKSTIDSGSPVIFPEEASVHDACEILKMYLRQLPERLIPENYTNRYNSTDTDDEILAKSLIIFEELSSAHKVIFFKLLGLFYRISQNQSVNKMTVHNLSTCFALIIFNEPKNVEGENAFLALEMTSTLQRVLAIMIENYVNLRKKVRTSLFSPFKNK